jgi:hypothetical protein
MNDAGHEHAISCSAWLWRVDVALWNFFGCTEQWWL